MLSSAIPSTGRVHGVASDRALAFDPQDRAPRVRALAGTVWVTQAGDGRDHVLRQGEAVSLRRGGRVLVLALSPTGATIAVAGMAPTGGATGV